MTVNPKDNAMPALLTPHQLAEELFQIPYDEKHLTHLRRHGGLPYLQFQIDGQRVFRYPRDSVLKWVEKRTHGALAASR